MVLTGIGLVLQYVYISMPFHYKKYRYGEIGIIQEKADISDCAFKHMKTVNIPKSYFAHWTLKH